MTLGEPAVLKGFGDGAGADKEPQKSLLSQLVERFNGMHGTSFTDKDMVVPFEAAVGPGHDTVLARPR